MAVTLNDEQLQLLRDLAAVRRERNDLKKREDALRASLLDVLTRNNSTDAITAGGKPAMRISSSPSSGVDKKKLEAMYPDVYAQVLTTGTVDKLIIDLSDDDNGDDTGLAGLRSAALGAG